jgi:TRAP-type C4-dicarboxylate transport system substrate-binding protein
MMASVLGSKRAWLRAGLLGAALAAGWSGAAAGETVLKAVTFAPARAVDIGFIGFMRYVEMVNAAGKGVVRIEHVGGPEAIPIRGQMQAVSRGVADWTVTFTAHSAMVPAVESVGLSELSPQEERKVGYIDLLDTYHNAIGVKVIGRTATDSGFFFFSKQPIRKIADFKGMKVRSHAGYDPFVKALGSVPVHMDIKEIYPGLERGVVQAAPYPLYVSHLGVHEVTKYVLADDFWPAHTTFSYINLRKWESLAPEAKKVLGEQQIKFEGEMLALAGERKKKEMDVLKSKGMEFISLAPDEAVKFRKLALDSKWDELKGKIPAADFEKITKMIRNQKITN